MATLIKFRVEVNALLRPLPVPVPVVPPESEKARIRGLLVIDLRGRTTQVDRNYGEASVLPLAPTGSTQQPLNSQHGGQAAFMATYVVKCLKIHVPSWHLSKRSQRQTPAQP